MFTSNSLRRRTFMSFTGSPPPTTQRSSDIILVHGRNVPFHIYHKNHAGSEGKRRQDPARLRKSVVSHELSGYPLCCIANKKDFQEGYSNSYPNTAYLSFQEYINESYIERGNANGLQEWQFTWLWSGILNVWFLGYMFGTFLTPYLTDNYGRKTALLIANIVSLLGTIVATVSIPLRWPELLFFSRIFASSSCGLSFGSLILFLQETTPTEQRGLTSFLSEVAFIATNVLGMGFGMDLILGKYLVGLIGVGAIPGVLAILIILPLKETPKYLLINRNNRHLAMQSLIYYRGDRADNEKVLEEMLKESDDKIGMPIMRAVKEVFARKHLRTAFVIGILALQIVVGIWPIIYLSTDLLEAHFSSDVAQFSSFGFILANFLASLCGMFAVDKFGRRPMIILFGTLNTFSLSGYVIFDRLSAYVDHSFSYGCIVSLVAYGITYGAALGPIAFFITSELTTQRFRSLVQSMVFAVNTANNFIFGFVTLPAYKQFDVWSFIPLFIIPSVLCIIYLARNMPETKGREIHQIVEDMARVKSMVSYSKISPSRSLESGSNVVEEEKSEMTTKL
uniref:MFS domain-containing protein n=1 Tax=Steinernema glaseri TaxID=37863 RepID=A0A1I7ZFS0_9BILA